MRKLTILTSALICLVAPVSAEQLDKKQVETMIKSLEGIKKAVIARQSKKNGIAAREFKKHVGSSVAANAFYLTCLKKDRFDAENKRPEAWRVYQEKTPEFQEVYHREAKQLELRYLLLTLQAAQVEDRREMMKPLISFLDAMLKADGRGFEYIESAANSVFSDAAEIEDTVDPGDWELDPTNIKGIYDQGILPHMRIHRDPRLVEAWKAKIRHMTVYAERKEEGRLREEREEERDDRKEGKRKNTDEFKAEAREEKNALEEFKTETLPETKWGMCEDLVEHGFRAEALPLMLEVIRAHPEYRDIGAWLASMDIQLKLALAELNGTAVPATAAP